MQRFTLIIIFLYSLNSLALMELGLSGTYKKTTYSQDLEVQAESITASISYYLWVRSAVEFSYTKGRAIRKEPQVDTGTSTLPGRSITQETEVTSLDFVLAFADRNATWQPYLKGGVAQIIKYVRIFQDDSGVIWDVKQTPSYGPSAGVGVKVKLTERFHFRLSLDAWSTPLDNDTQTLDTAGRIGFGWFF